jgi:hypothetical protein
MMNTGVQVQTTTNYQRIPIVLNPTSKMKTIPSFPLKSRTAKGNTVYRITEDGAGGLQPNFATEANRQETPKKLAQVAKRESSLQGKYPDLNGVISGNQTIVGNTSRSVKTQNKPSVIRKEDLKDLRLDETTTSGNEKIKKFVSA